MGSRCDASDRDVWKVEGMMGTALESAGCVRTWSHEVHKTREYLPSDGPLPTSPRDLDTDCPQSATWWGEHANVNVKSAMQVEWLFKVRIQMGKLPGGKQVTGSQGKWSGAQKYVSGQWGRRW
jgi:hypothetical protein